MRKYKKDKETERMLVKLSLLDEWIDLENYIKQMRKEAKEKSETWKEKLGKKLMDILELP